MSHWIVTGSNRRFKSAEDAELFRLDQVKRSGQTNLRIRKVLVSSPGQQTLSASLPSFSSRYRKPVTA